MKANSNKWGKPIQSPVIIAVVPKEEGVLHNTKQLSTLLTQLLYSAIGRVKRSSGRFIKYARVSLLHFTLPTGGVNKKTAPREYRLMISIIT